MMVEFIILLNYQQDWINNMYTQGPAHNDTKFFARLTYHALFSFSRDRAIVI